VWVIHSPVLPQPIVLEEAPSADLHDGELSGPPAESLRDTEVSSDLDRRIPEGKTLQERDQVDDVAALPAARSEAVKASAAWAHLELAAAMTTMNRAGGFETPARTSPVGMSDTLEDGLDRDGILDLPVVDPDVSHQSSALGGRI